MLKNKNISVLDKLVKTEQIISEKSLSTKTSTLLLEGPKENLDILKKIGLDHHIEINKQKIHEKNSVEMLSQIYGGKVYLGKDLKQVCNLYDLKLCPAKDHKGLPSEDIAEKIKTFMDNNSEQVPDKKNEGQTITKSKINLVYSNFFILAPSEEFLKTSTKSTACTLFYREEYDGNDYQARPNERFIEIYSWGNSYSSLRMFNHMYNTYEYNTGEDITVRSAVTLASIGLFVVLLVGIFTPFFNTSVVLSLFLLMIIFFNSVNNNIIHYDKWNQPKF